MDIPIYSYKVETSLEPVALILDIIIVKNTLSDEEKYHKEVEFKQRQMFNEYLYQHYYKFDRIIDNYTKERLWQKFKYEHRDSFSVINYLCEKWEQFAENYM
jgi:AICAR transformylase/IMP cyclohydrolase PurH